MRSFEWPSAPLLRRLRDALVCVVLTAAAGVAAAHKSSDSYLQLDAAPDALAVRWDIALRDLDVALDIDADADGQLTWGEVKAAWPRIESYAMGRLAIDGCPLHATGRALERRNDGAYVVLKLASTCSLMAQPRIEYTLFAEVDPTHRGIAKIERRGQALALLLLDPARPGAKEEGAASVPHGGKPADAIRAAPARWAFLEEGIRHILTGYDHVLFLLCLLLPAVLRRTPEGWLPVDRLSQAVLPIVGIVTAFTAAHSITLALAALKLVALPPSFVEPAIAVTIALAALDNVRPFFAVRRIVVTFVFGLVHGFGFASVLAELDLPTADFAWALLQFNVGLELGQLLVVVAVTTVLFGLREWRRYRPIVVRGGSLLAMAVAGVWFVERTASLRLLPF
ncbi:MAG TPA: HupE/UreJ family protein [Caldimonas sp.]|nr:HupE/UreJ family protein [Caldimonas sp.]